MRTWVRKFRLCQPFWGRNPTRLAFAGARAALAAGPEPDLREISFRFSTGQKFYLALKRVQ